MLFFPLLALAASHAIEVNPASLQSGTRQYKGPHFALTAEKPNGLLLLTLGGTNSLPKDLREFAEEGAKLGYHAIGIDYVNGPPDGSASTECRESKDPACFDNFRREVMNGEALSQFAKVSKEDSIEFRITFLLRHLASKHPKQWGKFLHGKEVDWSKVVAAGHSQGAGHVAFLAKAHALQGAILLAGPQDIFADGRTATWLQRPSLTSSNRFYALLHKKDFFGSEKQIAAVRALVNDPKAAIASDANYEKAHIFVSNREDVGDAHMSLIKPFFRDVWKHALQELVGE